MATTRNAGKGRSFTIKGLGEAQKALKSLPGKVQAKVLRQAMRAALRPVRAAAEGEAPVGETGAIKKAIKLRAMKRSRGRLGVLVRIGQGDFQGETWYGAAVHFGHNVVRAGQIVGHVPANEFISRAYQSAGPKARDDALKLIREGVAAAVEEARRESGG